MTKLCECGCGNPAPVATRTSRRHGAVRGQPKRFVAGHNKPRWKNGTTRTRTGHVLVMDPGHPRAGKHTDYVFAHILVAELVLGRPVPDGAVIHHIDGNPSNNAPRNLLVCDRAYHTLIHQRMRALDACGHADWRPCPFCHRHDDPANMIRRGKGYAHRECRNTYHRNYLARMGAEA